MITKLYGPEVTTILHIPGGRGKIDEDGITTADSVIVVPRLGGRLLMVRNARRRGWEFPGGKIIPGEAPGSAARREAAEEAGAILSELTIFCTYLVRKAKTVSRGIVYFADVISLGARTDTDVIDAVGLFRQAPGDVSFADGFIELMFREFGGAT